jgi:uncharacterized protein
MSRYVLGLLRRGVRPSGMSEEEENRLQEDHLAYLRSLREAGDLIVYGPLTGDPDFRGILVFRTESIDRARELMREDPWVLRGALVLQLFSWFAAAGLQVGPSAPNPTELDFRTD